MKIEISIVDESTGQRRCLAYNQQLLADAPGGHRPRMWSLRCDQEAIRDMTVGEQWAASHMLLNVACKWLMVSAEHPPSLAAAAAYGEAEREGERAQREARALHLQQKHIDLLHAVERRRNDREEHEDAVRRGIEHNDERKAMARERASQTPDDDTTASTED